MDSIEFYGFLWILKDSMDSEASKELDSEMSEESLVTTHSP